MFQLEQLIAEATILKLQKIPGHNLTSYLVIDRR